MHHDDEEDDAVFLVGENDDVDEVTDDILTV